MKTYMCDVCSNYIDTSDVKIVRINSSKEMESQVPGFVKDVCPTCMEKVYESLKISAEEQLQIFVS